MAKIRTSTYDISKNIIKVRTCSFDYRFLTGVSSYYVIYTKSKIWSKIKLLMYLSNPIKVKPSQFLDK